LDPNPNPNLDPNNPDPDPDPDLDPARTTSQNREYPLLAPPVLILSVSQSNGYWYI